MIFVLFAFWVVITAMIMREQKVARIIIYLGIFSLFSSVGYLMLGGPDVAMAEAATSAFTVIFFIICFEKYFNFTDMQIGSGSTATFLTKKYVGPFFFVLFLFGLVLYFRPNVIDATYLRDRYLASFMYDVGGQNPVTAIYLGYRIYDTLFEALVVVISVVAAMHLSAFEENYVAEEHRSDLEKSGIAVFAIQIICALMLLYGVYLIANGHLTPGGGFQGGLAVASFFICRYMIYDVNDLPIAKLNRMEEIIFIAIVLFAASIVFLGAAAYLPDHIRPLFQSGYMIVMNILIGFKVACGFIILFYRYIVIEQR